MVRIFEILTKSPFFRQRKKFFFRNSRQKKFLLEKSKAHKNIWNISKYEVPTPSIRWNISILRNWGKKVFFPQYVNHLGMEPLRAPQNLYFFSIRYVKFSGVLINPNIPRSQVPRSLNKRGFWAGRITTDLTCFV